MTEIQEPRNQGHAAEALPVPETLDSLLQLVEDDPESKAVYDDALVRDRITSALQSIRKAGKQTQTDVASKLGTVQSVISDLERGRSPEFTLAMAQAWARALGHRVDLAIVPSHLPSFGTRGLPNVLWGYVHKHSLSPILTTLVTHQNSPDARKLSALARNSRLDAPIVRAILGSLCDRGWVVKDAPILGQGMGDEVYSLNSSAATVIGLSLHPRRVEGVLLDSFSNVIESKSVQIRQSGRKAVVDAAVLVAKYLANKTRNVLGVGCSLAGVIEPETTGVVKFAPHLESPEDDWRNFNLEAALQNRIQEVLDDDTLLVAVENDANALALLRYWTTGNDTSCVVLMSGAGVGSGFLSDGNLVRGRHYAAGEGGHTCIPGDITPCRIGMDHVGCLETIASAQGVIERLGFEYSNSDVQELLDLCDARVQEGDEAARAAFRLAGLAVGTYLTNLAAIIDPEEVTLYAYPQFVDTKRASGSAFCEGFEEAWARAQSNARRYDIPTVVWEVLTPSVRAVAAGAAAMREFLEEPTRWRPAIAPDAVSSGVGANVEKTPVLELV